MVQIVPLVSRHLVCKNTFKVGKITGTELCWAVCCNGWPCQSCYTCSTLSELKCSILWQEPTMNLSVELFFFMVMTDWMCNIGQQLEKRRATSSRKYLEKNGLFHCLVLVFCRQGADDRRSKDRRYIDEHARSRRVYNELAILRAESNISDKW